MKLPEHERLAHREAFKQMNLGQKAEYIFAYYKLPLALLFVTLVAAGSVLSYVLTHKDAVLYVGLANVALTEEVDEAISSGYLDAKGMDKRTREVLLYRDLYLIDPEESADHQLSYASRLKVMATIDAEELDVMLMSRQSYDLLSHSGYLMDLSAVQDRVSPELQALICENDVIIRDNQVEFDLGEAETYEAETERVANAFDVSGLAPFGGLSDTLYLGIVGNTPRLDEALAYLAYLAE